MQRSHSMGLAQPVASATCNAWLASNGARLNAQCDPDEQCMAPIQWRSPGDLRCRDVTPHRAEEGLQGDVSTEGLLRYHRSFILLGVEAGLRGVARGK
eukprot:1154116-Pelagomonas_calceolata.AAC.1